MRHSAALLFASAVAPLLAVVTAQENCNYTTSCGSTYPCCSDFGFCGTDHCRGGCNPMWSFSPTSCDRLPLCESKTYTFADTSRIINATLFDGNVSKADWTIDNAKMDLSQHLAVNNGELGLFLTEENGGTRISSTRYMHYGRVTATMKVGHWKGVVVTMIGMSDAHDEIDWEWPGEKSAMEGQSNFFWLGVIDPKGGYHTPDGYTDGFSNFHDYAFDWSPDKLDWLIDGKVVRTVTKQETLDQNTDTYKYPTTPIRIQISIWPAGIAGVSQGIQEWAGGMINWNDPEYVAAGHFYTIIKQVTVQCNIAGDLAPPPDALSYVYGANVSGIPVIAYSNESAISGSPTFVSVAHSLLPLAAAGVLGLAALLF